MIKNLLLLFFSITVLNGGLAYAQSKKEIIEKLNHQADSLKKALSSKTETIKQLELKVSKLQSTVEANKDTVDNLEAKMDSINKSFAGKATAIDSLTTELTKVRTVFEYFKAEERRLSAKNESLILEISSLKQKLGEPDSTMAKGTSLAKDAVVVKDAVIAKDVVVKDAAVAKDAVVAKEEKPAEIPVKPAVIEPVKSGQK